MRVTPATSPGHHGWRIALLTLFGYQLGVQLYRRDDRTVQFQGINVEFFRERHFPAPERAPVRDGTTLRASITIGLEWLGARFETSRITTFDGARTGPDFVCTTWRQTQFSWRGRCWRAVLRYGHPQHDEGRYTFPCTVVAQFAGLRYERLQLTRGPYRYDHAHI